MTGVSGGGHSIALHCRAVDCDRVVRKLRMSAAGPSCAVTIQVPSSPTTFQIGCRGKPAASHFQVREQRVPRVDQSPMTADRRLTEV